MDVDRILKEVYHPVLPVLTYICHYHTVVLFQVLVLVGPFRKKNTIKHTKHRPGDSMWLFHSLVGGHLTIWKGSRFHHPQKGHGLNHLGRWTFGVFWSSAPSGIDVSHTPPAPRSWRPSRRDSETKCPRSWSNRACSSHRIHGTGIFTYIWLIFMVWLPRATWRIIPGPAVVSWKLGFLPKHSMDNEGPERLPAS